MPAQQISNTFRIELDGKALPPEIDVARVDVEDHLHLADTFSVTLHDMARTALTDAAAKIGSRVKISVVSEAAATPQLLISGEITAVEVEILAGATYTIVRGYDESHRLFRGRTTDSYRDMTYADIVKKVARRARLETGTVDPTAPTHRHVTQCNEDDWTFLSRLAQEVGFELVVVEGKVHFRRPSHAQDAPEARDLQSDEPLSLQAGSTLLYLRAAVTAAQQVKEVEVRSWDAQSKEPVVSTVPVETTSIDNGTTPAQVAETFPAPALVTTAKPYANAKEVELAAKALAEQLASGFTEMEGMARGNPRLRAGAAVTVGLLGPPFDGKYRLTTTKHSYDHHDGYVTSFTVSGRQERSTLSLAGGVASGVSAGASGSGGADASSRINGVVPAVVDDVSDPEEQCRVRLRLPWLSESYVSDWSRVVQAGAGNDRGWVLMPEAGDEVLVAFEQGDVRRPFVIGGLYNGRDRANTGPGELIDASSKSVSNRVFTSRKGHQLIFTDGDDECAVTLVTGDGGISVELDQHERKLTIKSAGDIEVTADGNIKLSAKGSVELSGQSVAVESRSTLRAKGTQIGIQGSGPVEVTGQPIKLN